MKKTISIVSTLLLSAVMLLSSIGSASAMPILPVQSTQLGTVYVGNLSLEATEEDIKSVFADYGSVRRVQLPIDRDTGLRRGFAFVDMETEDEESAAIASLDGAEWMGKTLKVNKARPREGRSRGGSRSSRDFSGSSRRY